VTQSNQKLKAPGTKRLKLKCDKMLPNYAFKFNLRRYDAAAGGAGPPRAFTRAGRHAPVQGGAVQVDPIIPTLKEPGTERSKLKHEDLLSNFGFKFNLRRYSMENEGVLNEAFEAAQSALARAAGLRV